MINYNDSMIYKLCCRNTVIKDIYIGSTTNFTRRKCAHKSQCNNPNSKLNHLKVYQFIREHGGWENWDMVLVEAVSCETKLELHKIERQHIEQNNSTLNGSLPSRSHKEYYQNNKDKRKEYKEKNKEKIKQKSKEYYQ